MPPHSYIRLCVFLCIFFVFSPVLAETPSGHSKISIGFFSPLSGSLSTYGKEMLNGCRMAVNEINNRGNVKLSLLIRDSKGDPEISSQIASEFSENKEVIAVVGGFKSDCNMVAAPIFDKAGILMISPTESHSSFTSIGENIFRANATQINEADFNAQWAKELGFESYISIYIDDSWGNNANDLFVISSREKNIVSKAEFPIGLDFEKLETILDYIQDQKIDFIYSILFHLQACQLYKSLKDRGLSIPILTASSLMSEKITANCESCSPNIMGPSSFPKSKKNDPLTQSFLKRYLANFEEIPSLYAALAYDSMYLVYIAITNSWPERNVLKTGMEKISNYQGITGLFTFKKNRSPGKRLHRMTFKNSQWTLWHPEIPGENISIP